MPITTVAMSMTIVSDGHPTHWVVAPSDKKGSSFQLFPWPPKPEHTFAVRAPFIQKMNTWIRDQFPSAKFGIKEVLSDNPTDRPKGRCSGKI